jgi:uncharacterized protein YbaP (TraB family)
LKRDKYSFEEIRKIDGEKILHVGGLNHIYGDYENLYERFKKEGFKVRRIKLNEAEEF